MQILEFEKENIGGAQIHDVCDKLRRDEVKALALRECVLTDKDYKRILKWVGVCKNLRHLSLSIGIIPDTFRVHVLAQALQKNQSLTGLFIHGNHIGEAGVKILHPSLLKHPLIISLDIGDCGIGDEGLELICQLLAKRHGHPGLKELVLSSNPDITAKGWATLGMAISAGCSLRSLYVDYNDLGDSSASCILVAVAGTKSLETLDMECVGATETTGQVLLHLVQNYSVSVTNINLEENTISQATLEAIKMHMPGLMEDELSNGIHSDEEHSLATSEPPLDPNCDLEELVTPTNLISIVGATDSPLYTPEGATDSPPYTPDGIATDRSVGINEEAPVPVVDEELGAFEANINETQHLKTNDMERDLSDDDEKYDAVSVNETHTALDMVPGLPERTEILYLSDDKLDAYEKDESENQLESEENTLITKKSPNMKHGRRQKNNKTGSLADRIKSQRENNETSNIVTVIPTAEAENELDEKVIKYYSSHNRVNSQRENNETSNIVTVIPTVENENELDEKGNQYNSSHIESNEKVDEETKGNEPVKLLNAKLPTFESVEEVEDIEELDENAINNAHDSLSIPETPSKMSLCSGPGVKSSSSIFDNENLLLVSPSHKMNKHRRYSHNIEINDKEKQGLQGLAKHRGSEGNILARFSNRRGSVPYNARLTVHGVGSSSNLDDIQSFDTKRRLSSASALGDVA